MLKFSLIIPIYNVEKFIRQCLDSLLDQDIPQDEYEIICVIDGSPDNSINIVREYQKKVSNIILIEHENRGLPSARNSGIEVAKGEYMWFVDPDDFILSDCLNFIYKEFKKDDYDRLRFYSTVISEETKYKKEKYTLQTQFDNKNINDTTCITYIVKSSVFTENNIKFNPKLWHCEDVFFTFQIKQLNLKVKILDEIPLYVYRVRAGSAMTNRELKVTRKRVDSSVICASEINKLRHNYLDDEKKLYNTDYQVSGLGIGALIQTFTHDRKRYKEVLNNLKDEGVFPFKTKKRYLNFKTCKNFKSLIFMYLEYFMCKKWFANFLAKIT